MNKLATNLGSDTRVTFHVAGRSIRRAADREDETAYIGHGGFTDRRVGAQPVGQENGAATERRGAGAEGGAPAVKAA